MKSEREKDRGETEEGRNRGERERKRETERREKGIGGVRGKEKQRGEREGK